MSELNLISKSLSSHYVYYERLKEDQGARYSAVHSQIKSAAEEAKKTRLDVSFIRSQADMEREKELKLIETMTSLRPDSREWVKETSDIIDAINLCLNSKDIYNRVRQTILANGATRGRGVYTFFGGYLQSTLNDMWPDFMQNYKGAKVFDITEQEIYVWLRDKVLPKAIERMFDAQVEDGVDSELQSAYQELKGLIGTFNQTNSFTQQLGQIYNIEGVAKEVKEIISKRTTKKKPGVVSSLTKNAELTYSRGGLTLEAVVDLIMEKITPRDGKSGHINVGAFKAKADNILTIGIDYSKIQEKLEEYEYGTREKNIDAFNALGDYLNNFHEGFIIYNSDKNYSLTKGFKNRGGFSAGESLSLQQYMDIMNTAGKNVETFIGAIEQLASGAVGQDMHATDYADIISKNIAYLLFDDFNTIGVGLENGVNAIHLVNLNGLFVPISAILYALVDALNNEESIKKIVYTNIKLPEIEFKTSLDQRLWEEKNPGSSAWAYQRSEMLRRGKIETHFLANLQSLLEDRTFR